MLVAVLEACRIPNAARRYSGSNETQDQPAASPSAGSHARNMHDGKHPVVAAGVLAYLPEELLQAGNRRTAATRLQAFMGNDPRLQQSGQWTGQIKMSKRGVEMLRTAFFQAAFSASQHDPELKAFYERKRAENKKHEVALTHLMRILTRRLVAVLRSEQPYRPKEVFPLQNAA